MTFKILNGAKNILHILRVKIPCPATKHSLVLEVYSLMWGKGISNSYPHTKPDEKNLQMYRLRLRSPSRDSRPQITKSAHTGSWSLTRTQAIRCVLSKKTSRTLLNHPQYTLPPHGSRGLPEVSHPVCIPLRKTEKRLPPTGCF